MSGLRNLYPDTLSPAQNPELGRAPAVEGPWEPPAVSKYLWINVEYGQETAALSNVLP